MEYKSETKIQTKKPVSNSKEDKEYDNLIG
jgi:hypothetical protein